MNPPFAPALLRVAAPSHAPAAARTDDPAHATPARLPPGRSARPRLSCVVPCWNEARNLALLLPQLDEALQHCGCDWELILVDDGSTDGTAALLAEAALRPGLRVLQLARNFGKEAALTAGLGAACGEVVLTMDADLQHPPALIAEMLALWRRGADMVYAARSGRADEGLLKRLGAAVFYRLMNAASGVTLPAGAGDFRLMDRVVVDALLALPERRRFMKGLYAWVGYDAVALPYAPPPRAHGRSRFGLWRLLRLSIDGLTAFSTWPLRAAGLFGGVLALIGFGYGGFVALQALLYGHPVPGWTTVIVSLLFLLGVQLVSIGILGEYVGRIFDEVKARPLYVVKRAWGRGLPSRES
ncbi:glycosyltransferase family 2 protein [Aquincola sp. S2]|uniref:Glycosyltransferase family 2 protein n=1 Tax=Pseudaquabacterium terrae TaxID=2732868 RepID=A0ABX2EQ56_9BURK|nr:glycosyltransferase family 2 protein [Aquabacterium terrae]NRF70830.1 glycosyltransferase family 2 protein [Aquabacterium terrae]